MIRISHVIGIGNCNGFERYSGYQSTPETMQFHINYMMDLQIADWVGRSDHGFFVKTFNPIVHAGCQVVIFSFFFIFFIFLNSVIFFHFLFIFSFFLIFSFLEKKLE